MQPQITGLRGCPSASTQFPFALVRKPVPSDRQQAVPSPLFSWVISFLRRHSSRRALAAALTGAHDLGTEARGHW